MREIDSPEFLSAITGDIPLQELEQRLKPGSMSQVGFLEEGESLLEVIRSDWEVVERFKTNHAEIAATVERLIRKELRPVQGFEYQTAKDLHGVHAEHPGEQSCPWGCRARGQTLGILVKTETLMNNLHEIRGAVLDLGFEDRRSPDAATFYVVVTGLLPHLIRQHLFFEGKESPYRADPKLLIQALGLPRQND